MGKYEDNLELLKKTLRCEPVDRVPVVPCANAYMARVNGVVMKEYINNFEVACEANLKELDRLEADGTQNVIFSPYLLGTQWLSRTAIPGVDLGDDDMWQVMEIPENMEFEDYERIKEMGWGWDAFLAEANTGKGLKVKNWMKPVFRYVVPVCVFGLYVFGLITFEWT